MNHKSLGRCVLARARATARADGRRPRRNTSPARLSSVRSGDPRRAWRHRFRRRPGRQRRSDFRRPADRAGGPLHILGGSHDRCRCRRSFSARIEESGNPVSPETRFRLSVPPHCGQSPARCKTRLKIDKTLTNRRQARFQRCGVSWHGGAFLRSKTVEAPRTRIILYNTVASGQRDRLRLPARMDLDPRQPARDCKHRADGIAADNPQQTLRPEVPVPSSSRWRFKKGLGEVRGPRRGFVVPRLLRFRPDLAPFR